METWGGGIYLLYICSNLCANAQPDCKFNNKLIIYLEFRELDKIYRMNLVEDLFGVSATYVTCHIFQFTACICLYFLHAYTSCICLYFLHACTSCICLYFLYMLVLPAYACIPAYAYAPPPSCIFMCSLHISVPPYSYAPCISLSAVAMPPLHIPVLLAYLCLLQLCPPPHIFMCSLHISVCCSYAPPPHIFMTSCSLLRADLTG